MKSFEAILFAGIVLAVSCLCCGRPREADKVEALKEFQEQVGNALPSVASLTGVQSREPVKVDLLTREELGKFFQKNLKIEYPNDELKKRGQCFAQIGLLPEGYDLESGFMTLLNQQAGAVYDLRSKTLIGLGDLPSERKRSVNNKMILSHELTHALQDRVIDLARESEVALKNIDYEYALRAVLEGMASSVMIAYAQNLRYGDLPDLQSFWRSQLSQASGRTLGDSPGYVTEYLMSPFAEGGAFIQAWQKRNPDKKLSDLLKEIPASSEQVLHFEKYARKDQPTNIDLASARKILPANWTRLYANTLGEFELLVLFQIHKETQSNAGALADGWDGCKFEAYEDENKNLILLGSSAWDSQKDAEEFYEGFTKVLAQSRSARDYEVEQNKERVNFLIGVTNKILRTAILKSLSTTTY
jgi:hypothetical protein